MLLDVYDYSFCWVSFVFSVMADGFLSFSLSGSCCLFGRRWGLFFLVPVYSTGWMWNVPFVTFVDFAYSLDFGFVWGCSFFMLFVGGCDVWPGCGELRHGDK